MNRCIFCRTVLPPESNDMYFCGRPDCVDKLKQRNINLFRKFKFLKSISPHVSFQKEKEELRLAASRPWSADCIWNLHDNLSRKWSVLKCAKETRRTIGDIKRMARIIEREGFEKVYFTLLKIETLQKKNLSEEILWLQKHGIIFLSEKEKIENRN